MNFYKKKKKKENFIVKDNKKDRINDNMLKKDINLVENVSIDKSKIVEDKSIDSKKSVLQSHFKSADKIKNLSDKDLITFIDSERIRKKNVNLEFPVTNLKKRRYKFSDLGSFNTHVSFKGESVNLTARKNVSVRMTFKQIERKFIGHLMQRGLRAKAVKIWLNFLIYLKRHFYNSPVKHTVRSIILKVVEMVRPVVVLKQRKIAGTVYQIPYFVQNVMKDNSTLIAIR